MRIITANPNNVDLFFKKSAKNEGMSEEKSIDVRIKRDCLKSYLNDLSDYFKNPTNDKGIKKRLTRHQSNRMLHEIFNVSNEVDRLSAILGA